MGAIILLYEKILITNGIPMMILIALRLMKRMFVQEMLMLFFIEEEIGDDLILFFSDMEFTFFSKIYIYIYILL